MRNNSKITDITTATSINKSSQELNNLSLLLPIQEASPQSTNILASITRSAFTTRSAFITRLASITRSASTMRSAYTTRSASKIPISSASLKLKAPSFSRPMVTKYSVPISIISNKIVTIASAPKVTDQD
ncbi:hypothetical protein C1645_837637 [Glomus cerebriforme]|uniref:Uncharacterized protein n=1 Tax=Glomus cerebriforme TaxID=658196 RepID=A0A397S3Q1_9GLOM|nr:hypothetical protein C1645_837637 [Glomus cerebriforme]